MKIIQKYVADDEREFTSQNECAEHEQNIELANKIMANLDKSPDSCDFKNGGGYVQHDSADLLLVRTEFLKFCQRYTDHKWIQDTIDRGYDVHPSYAGRILSECLPDYIYKHWHRFMCIDHSAREWGQPYFANNPDDAQHFKLN